MSCGIYKITNNINKKIYIGCSVNIERRWISHKSESILEKNPQYNYSIHKAFRKYGIDNFSFEIIELTSKAKLFEREKYWIGYYDSYNNGYNETKGGEGGPSLPGEKNPNSSLTEQEVQNIRTLLLQGKMLSEVYPLYSKKISLSGFKHIWKGDSWIDICPEAIEYVKSKEYLSKVRSFARKSQISSNQQEIWIEIQRRKENKEKRLDVYNDYKNIYSLSGFNKIWYKK